MVELRADGTLEGAPKVGRVYRMAENGVIHYALWTGEFETDFPSYIPGYDTFRDFETGFLPLAEAKLHFEVLVNRGPTKAEKEAEMLKHLKSVMLESLRAAEKAAHAYFAACPVGDERIWASEVFDNVRNATRV